MKLSAAERRNLPDDDFALPEYRMFPIYDPGHIKAGAGRISQAFREGRITPEEYARAESRVLAAERHFGMHSTVYPEMTVAAFDNAEDTNNLIKIGAIGSVLAGTALLAWFCRPKGDDFATKRAAGAPAGLRNLAAALTPQQKTAVHAARAAGMSPLQALASVGVSAQALSAAAR